MQWLLSLKRHALKPKINPTKRGEFYVELQSRADSHRFDAWNRPLDTRGAAAHRYPRIGDHATSRGGIATLAGSQQPHGQAHDGVGTAGTPAIPWSAHF